MSKNKTILFRADSSSKIGTGHIMRDLVLAKKYAKKGAKIIFATQNLEGNINHTIEEAGFTLELLDSNGKKELKRLIKKLDIDLLVIDHYKIDYKKERYIKEKTGVKILSFDDTYKRHHCDILLNHNISAEKKRYKKLVPQGCKIQCGKKYTLLREEFYMQKRALPKKKRKFKQVLVVMGGADTTQLNIKILKVLKHFLNMRVSVVTTTANRHLKKLKRYCRDKSSIELHINSNNIANLMASSDFAIVTTSSIVHELLYMELPFIAIKVIQNQQRMYEYLKKEGYAPLEQFSSKKLLHRIKAL
jgi:UDP-2,4-diacetamido-2,4,6-trideoxy-beta-L-altropyranose hydrolase